MSRSLIQDLNNPNLFIENKKGKYSYADNQSNSKSAFGNLRLTDEIHRSNKAQLEAGGDARRERGNEWGADDGGHLIGARFGGSPFEENLTAQNRNLNRQDYKLLENKWADHLKQGDGYNVFVNVETYGEDRPDAYMGYAIYEYPDGTRTFETFNYTNEGRLEQSNWDEEFDDYIQNSDYDSRDLFEEHSLAGAEGANYSGEYAEDYGDELSEDKGKAFQYSEKTGQEERASDLINNENEGEMTGSENEDREELAYDLISDGAGETSDSELQDNQEEQASDLSNSYNNDETQDSEKSEQEDYVRSY